LAAVVVELKRWLELLLLVAGRLQVGAPGGKIGGGFPLQN